MASTTNKYRLERWHKLNAEERSWILLRSFKGGYISQQQASELTGAYTLSWLTTFAAPVALYPAYKFGLGGVLPGLRRRLGARSFRALSLGLTAATFLVWKHYNPFNATFLAKKEELLGDVEGKLQEKMMMLNEMIPRHYTEYEVMRRIRVENHGGYFFGMFRGEINGVENRDTKPKVNKEKWPIPVTSKVTM